MTVRTLTATFLAVNLAVLLPPVTSAQPQARAPQARPVAAVPAYQRFLSPASPLELVAAKTVDRVAWTAFEEGKRNAYTAAAPAFKPVRLTNFMTDNGTDLSGIRISDDGSTVVFIRGTAPNRDGWVANPTADPDGPERAVWAARTAGGRGLAGRARCGQPGARARRQRDPLRQRGADLPRPRDADAAGERAGSRREAVHHPVGRAERSEVVARRPQDRVRQHAHRPQLHHDLRRRVADGEVHVAERRLRHEPAVDGRQQECRLRATARAARSGSRRSRVVVASAFRTVPPSSRTRKQAEAVAAAAMRGRTMPEARRRR